MGHFRVRAELLQESLGRFAHIGRGKQVREVLLSMSLDDSIPDSLLARTERGNIGRRRQSRQCRPRLRWKLQKRCHDNVASAVNKVPQLVKQRYAEEGLVSVNVWQRDLNRPTLDGDAKLSFHRSKERLLAALKEEARLLHDGSGHQQGAGRPTACGPLNRVYDLVRNLFRGAACQELGELPNVLEGQPCNLFVQRCRCRANPTDQLAGDLPQVTDVVVEVERKVRRFRKPVQLQKQEAKV